MGSHKVRNIQPDRNNNGVNPGNGGGQPNMNNLGQFLNNVDLNQVMGQLSQMLGGGGGGGGGQPQQGYTQGPAQAPRTASRDPRLELLQAMKPFLNPRRSDMIDRIGQFYAIARIVQGQRKR